MTATPRQIAPSGSRCSDEVAFLMLSTREIVSNWPRIATMLAPALNDPQRYTIRDLFDRAMLGRVQLWVAASELRGVLAAFATDVLEYPRSRTLRIFLGAGTDHRAWSDKIRVLEEYARSRNCQHVEIQGRRGWERVFPDYEHRYVVLAREV